MSKTQNNNGQSTTPVDNITNGKFLVSVEFENKEEIEMHAKNFFSAVNSLNEFAFQNKEDLSEEIGSICTIGFKILGQSEP